MTKQLPSLPDDLPPELAEHLKTVPPITARDVAALKEAGARLESDPLFQADLLKSFFVEKMHQALEERKQTKAGLAGILKKSRQYIQKLFNEAKQVNFTLETMCEVAHALRHRVHVFVCRDDEEPVIVLRPRFSPATAYGGNRIERAVTNVKSVVEQTHRRVPTEVAQYDQVVQVEMKEVLLGGKLGTIS